MKKYKVWIVIENINEEEDFYEDVGMPESLGEFDTLEEAKEFVTDLCDNSSPDLNSPTNPWLDDKEFPSWDWRQEAANDDTRLGYLEWVRHKKEAAEG